MSDLLVATNLEAAERWFLGNPAGGLLCTRGNSEICESYAEAEKFFKGKRSIEEVHREYLGWEEKTFPGETSEEQGNHLLEELTELVLTKWEEPGEYADVLMLLFALAKGNGVDIWKAFLEKFEVNKGRRWVKTERGWRHEKEKEKEK